MLPGVPACALAQPHACQAVQLGVGGREQRIARARIAGLHSSD